MKSVLSTLSKIAIIIFGIAIVSFFGFFILITYIVFLLLVVFFNKKFFNFRQSNFNFKQKSYKNNTSTNHEIKSTISIKNTTSKPYVNNDIQTVKRNLKIKDGEISS